jgi:Flp pilus assembly CpaE family ATPase
MKRADQSQAVEKPPAESRAPVASGPLLAVCGLAGGAGASTLAFLVARGAARSDHQPVLVCDTGGPVAGLAGYAGVSSPRSLAGAADALAREEPLSEGLFAQAETGLRVIAHAPELDGEGDARWVAHLLRDAREAHLLTVVDCGTLARQVDRQALAGATHVAWVLAATRGGLRRARQTLGLLPRDPARLELVVARHDAAGRAPPTAELAALAAERGAPLVLLPHVPDLAERSAQEAADAASVTLRAIQGVLAR